jgi:HAE1 family hydrophobic/amphiphilic exporter-1
MYLVHASTRRRVTILMFTIGIMLFGAVSLSRLKLNLLPDLSYPTLTIRTEYEGAAPAEVENLVSKPIEEILGAVKNVTQVRSISRTGQSDVTLEFAWGTNMDYASMDVREKLDALFLPLEVERPVILRFDPTLDPVLRYALFTESSDDPVQALKYLRRFADEQVKKDLEAADGVASVKISGGLEEEIQVLIDQRRLAQLGIAAEQLVSTLRSENINLSGGRLEEGTQQYLVRTLNEFTSVDEIRDLVIAQRDGKPLYVRDVAEVVQGYKEREAISRLNGKEAVEVAVYKEGDANTVTVADAVGFRLNQLSGMLPNDLNIEKVYDQSTFIRQAVDDVTNSAIVGGLLAIVVLFIFLRDLKSTIIIGVSIPVSVIATFNLMYGYDITLNIMSLGGIALGIGMLVDNSIVVLENISRHRAAGKSVMEAARDGASEVGNAVIASTLTTVAVFFPLVFVDGIAGQLFRDQALTVTFSLLASLLVAITLIPMLSSISKSETPVAPLLLAQPKTRFGRITRTIRVFVFYTLFQTMVRWIHISLMWIGKGIMFVIGPLLNAFEKGYMAMENRYPLVIDWALRNKALVLITALTLFGTSLLMIPMIGVELIPSLSQGEYTVELRMPPGTPLERTDEVMRRTQEAAMTDSSIARSFAVAGSGNRMDANPDNGGENWGEVSVSLQSGANAQTETQSMEGLRTTLQTIPGLQYKFDRPALFSFRTPIEVEVTGFDLDHLKKTAESITRLMREDSRFADVKSTMEQGYPEIQVVFDRAKVSALGLNLTEVANTMVTNIKGDVATRYSWRDRKIDVLVRSQESDRASVEEIRKYMVKTADGQSIPIDAIATIETAIGPSEIRRSSQQRVAVVSANLAEGDLGEAIAQLESVMASVPMPEGIYARMAGQSQEMDSAFNSLLIALTLAVFLVYLVMASQFESLIHPFVILFTIPLAAIGAVWALWLTGSTISVVVFIGLILLAGIVVNNAIVLIDLINQMRERGMEKFEAIREAGRSRLRPILMTTLTTVLGLLPLSLGVGEGAEIRAPMGITVIGGLVVSTLLTLVVIPVMYALLDRKTYKVN